MLQHYVDHRRQVVRRRTQFELDKARDRAHILEGLKIALDHLDDVIKTIRAAKDPAIAESELIRKFQLTERQAKAILELRLQRLTQLERSKIQDEYEEMIKRIAYLEDILAHEAKVLYLIKEELLELKKKYGDERRTEIRSDGTGELNEEDLIPKEDVVVTLTHKGYCKRVPITAYRAQRRGGKGVTGMGTREADYVEHLCITNTHSEMLFFTQRGRVFRLRVHEIPDVSRQAKGLPIINLIEIDTDEKVTAALTLPAFTEDQYLIMVTRQGQIKKTPARAYEQVRRNGLIAIALTDKDELDWVQVSSGADEVLIASTDGKAVRFSEKQVRPMGRDTQGVRGIRLRPKAEVAGMDIVRKGAHVLVVSERGYGKLTPIDDYPQHGRGGQGVFTLNVTPRVGKLVGLRVVQDLEEELMVISTQGIVIRTRLADIRISGRQTQGVIIMRLDEGDTVASIAGVGNRESVEE
jgi:DNA gyrase subunit A